MMLIVVGLFSSEVELARSDNTAMLRSTCYDETDHFPLV